MAIVLQETLRAVFYAPFYAALALGAYRDEGLEVGLESSARPEDAARAVSAGAADVAWGGPMRVMVARDRQPDSDLTCFCEVVTRDPFLLVGREPRLDFRIVDLLGLRLGTVGEVPTPWCCLQEDIRRAGLDPQKLDRRTDRTMAQNAAALRAGEVDVIQVLEPFAQDLIAEGSGHLWYAAADRGATSYTCFYARRPVLESRRTEFTAMTRAMLRTQKWVHLAAAVDIARAIASYFPSLATERLIAAIANYQRLHIWGKDPHLPRAGYDTLAAGLLSAGLIGTAPHFTDAVDNSLAAQAIAADPPALAGVPL
jgi:NitT/TauT family transport system substrate-binding protein